MSHASSSLSCHGSGQFAPKEHLNQPGTVYVIMSVGYVGVQGRLLSKNNYWGEDCKCHRSTGIESNKRIGSTDSAAELRILYYKVLINTFYSNYFIKIILTRYPLDHCPHPQSS